MPLAANRHWLRPRFSLTALFVVVSVIGVWLGVQAKWIRDRQEFIFNEKGYAIAKDGEICAAPGVLGMFGELGSEYVWVYAMDDKEEAARLFPEAEIYTIPRDLRFDPITEQSPPLRVLPVQQDTIAPVP